MNELVFDWAKKLGPKHIMRRDTTMCGKPLLGNNYIRQRADAPPCKKCVKEHKQLYGSEE